MYWEWECHQTIHVFQLALFVGSLALTFQLTVLYPWHHELSDSFDEVNKVIEHTKNEGIVEEQPDESMSISHDTLAFSITGIARKTLLETAKNEGLERKAIAERLDKQLSDIDAMLDPQLELEAVNKKLDAILELVNSKK